MLRYAADLTQKGATDPHVLEELKTYLSERELVELNLTVGLANLTNRLNESFAIELP
ncbi:MAG: hypothetical protein AB1671_03995 [Thermodesulfobacteriota bacterium]